MNVYAFACFAMFYPELAFCVAPMLYMFLGICKYGLCVGGEILLYYMYAWGPHPLPFDK